MYVCVLLPISYGFLCVPRYRQHATLGTVRMCKRKWINMRDTYYALVRRSKRFKARDQQLGIPEPLVSYESKWPYYKAMSFIEDHKGIRHRSTGESDDHTTSISADDVSKDSQTHSISEIKTEPTQLNDDQMYGLENDDGGCEYYDFDSDDMAIEEFQSITAAEQQNSHTYVLPKAKSAMETNENLEFYAISAPDSTTAIHKTGNSGNTKYIKSSELQLLEASTISVRKSSNESLPLTVKNENPCISSTGSEKRIHTFENLEHEEKYLIRSTQDDVRHSAKDHHMGDPDYNFLISFLPQMKKMNDVQNLQFRARMSEVVLNILVPSTATHHQSVPPPLTANPQLLRRTSQAKPATGL